MYVLYSRQKKDKNAYLLIYSQQLPNLKKEKKNTISKSAIQEKDEHATQKICKLIFV